jgi:prepilin-type N-terminal cleavage/methylation domain-containing protein/prepilin-type processing-associated H-X9-DG protein
MAFSPVFRRASSSHSAGFTLIELIAVIAIVALLANLMFPSIQKVRKRAESMYCANNLRQIGVAVNLFLQDNDNRYPVIEPMPSNPIYTPAENFNNPRPMKEALAEYGVTDKELRCPVDQKTHNYFLKEGSSYMWSPMLDDEPAANPVIYWRDPPIPVKSSRVRLCTDFEAVHNGRMNRLYGDGHVVPVYK